MVTASAPGKAILFGEHAVVYGRPALAVPVTQVQATATAWPAETGVRIEAPDIGRSYDLAQAPAGDALAAAARLVQARATNAAGARLRVQSTIPVAAGLGSGAAVCTATVRALAALWGLRLDDAEVSVLVFEAEKLLHGTPSGIDNTVVAYGRPVYFVRGGPPEVLQPAQPLRLLIADTGVPSPTSVTVGDVRAGRQRDPQRYEALFDEMGAIAQQARAALEMGDTHGLGPLMARNHALLRDLDVSSPELDRLVQAACQAGAPGAKLSGGGRGGNMIALVTADIQAAVRAALLQAGAVRVLETYVGA
jgi:mevalonate kinase